MNWEHVNMIPSRRLGEEGVRLLRELRRRRRTLADLEAGEALAMIGGDGFSPLERDADEQGEQRQGEQRSVIAKLCRVACAWLDHCAAVNKERLRAEKANADRAEADARCAVTRAEMLEAQDPVPGSYS